MWDAVVRDPAVDRWTTNRAAMVPLPPFAPAVGLTNRVRLGGAVQRIKHPGLAT